MTARALFGRPLISVAHVDFLRLPGIVTTEVEESDGLLSVQAEVAEPITKCPACKREGTLKGDGAPSRRFWDLSHGKPCWVTLRKQLYQCEACKEPCTHDLDFLPPPKTRITTRLMERIYYLLDLGITYSDVARITGPTEATIRAVRNKREAERAKTRGSCDKCEAEHVTGLERVPSVFLGLDNWHHGKRKKMRGILVDVVRCMPIDLFPDITKETIVKDLGGYLAAHQEVKVIVIDMDSGFRNVIQKNFSSLIIVIDHFHVMQALEKRISRICGEMAAASANAEDSQDIKTGNLFGEGSTSPGLPKSANPKQKKLTSKLKKYRRVFMKKAENRNERDRNLIRAWAASFPLLDKVIERRDAFYGIWDSATSSTDAQARFDAWKRSLSEESAQTPDQIDQDSGQLAAMYAPFVDMVKEWGKEIFAFFDFPERPTNAFTEAMVREVKSWNDMGRHVSFPVLRARFIYYNPKTRRYKQASSPGLTAATDCAAQHHRSGDTELSTDGRLLRP